MNKIEFVKINFQDSKNTSSWYMHLQPWMGNSDGYSLESYVIPFSVSSIVKNLSIHHSNRYDIFILYIRDFIDAFQNACANGFYMSEKGSFFPYSQLPVGEFVQPIDKNSDMPPIIISEPVLINPHDVKWNQNWIQSWFDEVSNNKTYIVSQDDMKKLDNYADIVGDYIIDEITDQVPHNTFQATVLLRAIIKRIQGKKVECKECKETNVEEK